MFELIAIFILMPLAAWVMLIVCVLTVMWLISRSSKMAMKRRDRQANEASCYSCKWSGLEEQLVAVGVLLACPECGSRWVRIYGREYLQSANSIQELVE